MRRRLILAILSAWLLCMPVHGQECTEHDLVLYTEPSGCTTPGFQCYVCSICGHSEGYENTPELGHDFGAWELIRQASCSGSGLEQCQCARCGQICEREIPVEPHSFEESVILPTCKADGYTLWACKVCAHREKRDVVAELGHDYRETVTEPTCTAGGYTRHVCSRCDDAYRTDTTEKLGHEYDEGVETKEPTLTTMGRLTYTCQRCADSYTQTTPKWVNPFLDLDKKAYYFSGVLWAYNNGITNGISDQSFGPEGKCTRAQIVTFLWRMEGMPAASGEGSWFADVPADGYYAEAVRWAVEQGITKGIGDGLFGPERVCSRSEAVTFLYRAKGGTPVESQEGFLDISREDFCFDPVYWAYCNGITTGTSTNLFSPDLPCSRGQIVTFLYRTKKINSDAQSEAEWD